MSQASTRTWEHVTETVLLLGAGAFAGTAVLPRAGVPGWAMPATWMILGVIASFTIWAATGSGAFSAHGFFFGLFLGTWTIWAEAAHLWHAIVIMTLGGGTLVFIPWGAKVWPRAVPVAAARARIQEEQEADNQAELDRWDTLFAEHGCKGVQTLQVTEERAGRVLRLQLPRSGGVTITTLENAAGNIEVSCHLKPGAVEFLHGEHSADIIMRLRERDVLADKVYLKPEHRATTIRRPFAVGVQEDGSIAQITLRELHAMIIATTGGGKSNLINVILAQLSGMVDVIVWVIDMKGGRVAKPWLRPWIEGKTGGPVIDWVATTREEAALMMTAFVAMVDYRMHSGIGGSKITPKPDMPQIVLICDEMADLFGSMKGPKASEGATTNNQFIAMGETVTQKGRSEAAATVWASQRGVNSMAGSGDMKANCKLRIMLGTTDENEARYVNANNYTAQKRSAAMLDTPGAGVITEGKKSSLLTKFFYLDHPADPDSGIEDATLCDDGCVPACPVYRVAMETGDRRPRLDRGSAAAGGNAYARRWDRARESNLVPAGGVTATLVQDADPGRFDEVMAEGGMPDPDARLPLARKRMREILAARGVQGSQPNLLHAQLQQEGFAEVRETIQRWLKLDAEIGICHRADFGRWKIGPDPDKNKASAA